MFSKLKLVIFDCDGVLVDSEPVANQVLADYLTAIGLPHTPDQCNAAYRGLSMQSMIKKIERQQERQLPAAFEQELQAETFARFERQLPAVEGVEQCIRVLLENRVPICVASSGSHEKLNLTLSLTGLKHYFSANIFSAHEVEHGKPAPDLFLYAARRMSVKPADVVVIEDSVPGVQAALAANMPVVAYCSNQEERTIMEKVIGDKTYPLISRMNELIPALQRGFG